MTRALATCRLVDQAGCIIAVAQASLLFCLLWPEWWGQLVTFDTVAPITRTPWLNHGFGYAYELRLSH